MKTTVIYHSADADGLFCREIAKKFLPPDTEFIGWDFKDQPLPVPVEQDTMFYIMDLPIDRVFGLDFSKGFLPELALQPGDMDWGHFVWIDHHKTSIDSHPKEIPGYRIDGVAACRLAYAWFTHSNNPTPRRGPDGESLLPLKEEFIARKVIEPLAVRLAGEYDVHDLRDPRAELFQFGLKSEEITPAIFETMLSNETDHSITVDILLENGKPFQEARAKEYAEVITQQGFTVQFEGLTFLACNSHELDIRSQLFEAGIKPEHDGLAGFTFNGKTWRVSLYGVPGKPDIDFSVIAKKFGGGGHRQACGFRCEQLPFIALKNQ